MNVVPDPVLGLESNKALDAREQRIVAASQTALRFAIASVFLISCFLIVGLCLYPTRNATMSILLGSLSLLSFFCWLPGLGFGVYAVRTRLGEMAVILSLFLMALGPIAWVVVAEMGRGKSG